MHVPQLIAQATKSQILGAGLPCVPQHRMSHEEQVAMWQGRYAVCKDLEAHPCGLGRLLMEAENQLCYLRSLEKVE